jgi:uncharacterized protein YndB with AHSA1/START domain
MGNLGHELESIVTVRAIRATVFRHFTDSRRVAAWWGAGSRVDPRPGGEVYIRYPNGVEAAGAVVELEEPERIVFTYGYASGLPFGPGASLVTVALAAHAEGTALTLRHAFADAAARDQHVQGWRYQLAVLANVAAREQHAGVEAIADRFLAVWSETDDAARRAGLAAIAVADLSFRDEWAATGGIDALAAHIGAAQQHMPGVRLEREGPVRHCQGTALVDWVVRGRDGAVSRRGTNVLELAPDGRIAGVVGLWAQ